MRTNKQVVVRRHQAHVPDRDTKFSGLDAELIPEDRSRLPIWKQHVLSYTAGYDMKWRLAVVDARSAGHA
jgi:hypothetical protein